MRVAVLAAVIALFSYQWPRPSGPARVRLTDQVLVKDVSRFGVNLGTWTSWGAEQLSSNIVKNPGFEGMIDRAIVIVKNPFAGGFDDNETWLARPDHFWDGAGYEILTGSRSGLRGTITRSVAISESGLPSFEADRSMEGLSEGDAISLTRISDSLDPADWWFTRNAGASYKASSEVPPGTSGLRSLRMLSTGGASAEAISYFDAIGDRAGKTLPLKGTWRLSFWSRLESGAATLEVTFARDGAPAILARNVPQSGTWSKTEYVFETKDDGPSGIVSLKFQVRGNIAGGVLLDDVDLRRNSDSDSAFRGEVRDVLSELQPGYLRDWQGQLGDTLANRLAPPAARRTSRYRPGDISQADYAYSLPEFLDLALGTGASPWITVPTTFSQSECYETGVFLKSDARYKTFSEILVEFGNENWNGVFRPAGIVDIQHHAAAADRCLQALQQAAAPLQIHAIVNAQHANPDTADRMGLNARSASIVAVAPYFLHSLAAGLAPEEAQSMLFEGDGGRMASISGMLARNGKELAVYEVGPHTNEGTATDEERLHVTSGMASASALAVTMLDGLAVGARRQCVYSLAGFDNRTTDGNGMVRLWGITRDLGETHRLRPTGLSLELMNRAIRGDLLKTTSDDPEIHVYAFQRNGHWSAVIASSGRRSKVVRVQIPAGTLRPEVSLTLRADSPDATNESGPQVSIVSSAIEIVDGVVTVDLPPFGLAALVASEEGKGKLRR